MFHNVLFIVLTLTGLYLLSLSLDKGARKEGWKLKFFSWRWERSRLLGQILAFLAGGFIGLAVITRTSELLWLAPSLFIIWLFYARRWGLAKLLFFGAGFSLALIPVAHWNTILYESPLRGGYNEMNRSLTAISQTGGELVQSTVKGQLDKLGEAFHSLADNVFYFGFNAEQSLEMLQHYLPEMFPVLLYAGLFGLFLLIVQNIFHFRRRYLVYFLVWLLLSVILVFYYGSWRFNDNPDPSRFTIGNSYTRYWLPIYLGLMPLAALGAVRLSRAFLLSAEQTWGRVQKTLAIGWEALVVLFIALPSLLFVFSGSEEGLIYLYYNNRAEKEMAQTIFSLTEPEAIIITQYYDKFFWPERRVIMGKLPNEEILAAAQKLVAYYPVYYYNFYLNQADLDYLNARKLAPYELEISLVKQTNDRFGLYRLSHHIYEENSQ